MEQKVRLRLLVHESISPPVFLTKVLFVPGNAFIPPSEDLRTVKNPALPKSPYVRAAFSIGEEW